MSGSLEHSHDLFASLHAACALESVGGGAGCTFTSLLEGRLVSSHIHFLRGALHKSKSTFKTLSVVLSKIEILFWSLTETYPPCISVTDRLFRTFMKVFL